MTKTTKGILRFTCPRECCGPKEKFVNSKYVEVRLCPPLDDPITGPNPFYCSEDSE